MNDNSDVIEWTEPEYKPFDFKNYNDRLIACNGDCVSNIAKIIDYCVHQKDLKQLNNVKKTIENAFWCYGSPIRNILINGMKHKQIYKENEFYQTIYNQLREQNCFIDGDEWIERIKSLL